jgi:hypothetical protein
MNYKNDYLGEMKPGFFEMSDEKYFEIKALSNTFLKRFDKSPEHALTPLAETASMAKGSLFHSYLLENEFEDNYYIAGPTVKDRRSKDYKLLDAQTEKTVLLQKEIYELEDIKKRLDKFTIKDVPFINFLQKGKKEVVIIWKDERNGIYCKAKIDLYVDLSTPFSFDLKSTQDASPLKGGFEKSILTYSYARQAAFYTSGIKALTGKNAIFPFIAIEKDPPYGIKSHIVLPEYHAWGSIENQKSIDAFLKWDGKLTNYSHDINYIELPKWLN